MVRENINWKLICTWYLCFSFSVLVLAIIFAATLNLWQLVYAVLLLSPSLLLVESLNLFNLRIINKQIQLWNNKKRIIIISIVLYLVKSLLFVLPFILGLLINYFVLDIFNVYMMIAFLCVSLVVFNTLLYLDSKGKLKINFKRNGGNK